MGRNITAIFRGRRVSLYDVWDHEITATIMKDSPSFWWGGWTHVQRTRVEYEMDGNLWKKDEVAMFGQWADDSAKFVCENVYKRIPHEELQAGVFTLTETLYESWKREMLNRILVAGARTAIVLNAVLEQRDVGNLRSGTAVSELEGEGDEDTRIKGMPTHRRVDQAHQAHGAKPTHGPDAAAINFGIFVVVFVIFHQVMRCWHNRDPVKQADRAKHSDGGKKI